MPRKKVHVNLGVQLLSGSKMFRVQVAIILLLWYDTAAAAAAAWWCCRCVEFMQIL
jgi:hypothetical protein